MTSPAPRPPHPTRLAVFVLNLDGEDELREGPAYRTPPSVARRALSFVPRLGALVGDALVVVPGLPLPAPIPGARARLFSQTPGAVAAALAVTGRAPRHPAVDVMRRVASRRFHAALGQTLGGAFVTSAEALGALVGGRRLVAKRALSFAGRGHVFLDPEPDPGALARLRGWIASDGGVQVEPWVRRVDDLSIHGFVCEDGALALGEPVRSQVDARGVWRGTEPLGGATEHEPRLRDEARRVGAALHDEGYFGPFGVDAFTWSGDDGATRLCARCEVNPRYSMGWALGMGSVPCDALEP